MAKKKGILARVERSLAGEPVRLCALHELVETIGTRSGGRGIEFGSLDRANLSGLVELTRWRRHWRRPIEKWCSPKSDSRRAVFASLANHLLAMFPVPEFMATAWWRRDDAGPAHRELFVHIARGNNPRTGPAPVPMTRRIAHHFLHAPAGYSIEQAVRWAQVIALGGTPDMAGACAATRLGESLDNNTFWMSVIRWFVAHPTFDLHQVGPVIDFIRNVKFGENEFRRDREPAPRPGFSMAGRTPGGLLRAVERWHAQLHRDRDNGRALFETWPTCGIHGLRRETTSPRTTTVWSIEELLSTSALMQEGREMGHCVASYAGRCAAGDCSIWRVKGAVGDLVTGRWTVELGRRREIVQARGEYNAPARGEVLDVLRHWAARENLTLADWL